MGSLIEPTITPPRWSLARRILFRFVSVYFVLYLVPLPYVWEAVVPWVGEHLFHVKVSVAFTGSGDMTYNYVILFCQLVLAATAMVVWSLLDRKRTNYVRLHDWLRAFVRIALATIMLTYGAVKIIPAHYCPVQLTAAQPKLQSKNGL